MHGFFGAGRFFVKLFAAAADTFRTGCQPQPRTAGLEEVAVRWRYGRAIPFQAGLCRMYRSHLELFADSGRHGLFLVKFIHRNSSDVGGFFSGIMQVPMGFLADRLNRKMMVVVGGVIISFAIFSFEWADGFGDLVLANVLFGFGGGIAMPALMALAVLKGSSSSAMGSVMGLLAMSHSLGMLVGSLLAGLMMDIFQLRHAFPFGGVIMLLSVGIFFICTYYKEEAPARADVTTGTIDL